jgi:hypothetical protein
MLQRASSPQPASNPAVVFPEQEMPDGESCPTVRVRATSQEQGDYVVINQCDFDPAKHRLYDPQPPTSKKRAQR